MQRRYRQGERGQVIPLVIAAMLVLIGIGGLTIDLGHQVHQRTLAQAAADAGSLAGASALAVAGSGGLLTAPPASSDTSVAQVHDYAAANGLSTVFNASCVTTGSGTFSESWFDSSATGCTPSTFSTEITVNVPPVTFDGSVASECAATSSERWNCIQVIITIKTSNALFSALGRPNSLNSVESTAIARPTLIKPSTNSAISLYQPQVSCSGQCFNESAVPSKTLNTCASPSNCPTFWTTTAASNFLVTGVDGKKLTPVADVPALVSNGDIVIGATTATACDPYGAVACAVHSVAGEGFSLNGSGSHLYCTKYGGGAQLTHACINQAGWSLGQIYGNESAFSAIPTWSPVVSTSGLLNCGGLILNGDPVSTGTLNTFFTGSPPVAFTPPAGCITNSGTINPGIYQYIVINHGTYNFSSGLYDITSVAPVDTDTTLTDRANGIDHSRETLAADVDLCTTGARAGCGAATPLTAGVWIGHGTMAKGSLGENTVITSSGAGVTFRFESTSGGFVSTNEISSIGLAAPTLGTSSAVSGAPLLFDIENGSTTHLSSGSSSGNFTGLIYQTQTATKGGVDIDGSAGTGTSQGATVTGQILAYSMMIFHTSGTAVNFQNGFGTATTSSTASVFLAG